MAISGQAGQGVGTGQGLEILATQTDALFQDRPGTTKAARDAPDQLLRTAPREPLDHPQPQPQRRRAVGSRLQPTIPVARADIDRTHLDTLTTRLAEQLGRGIEAHGLAVEERGEEGGRLMMLEPAET
jgi:hypothetical protein